MDAPPFDSAKLKSALKMMAMLVQKFSDDDQPSFMRLSTELAQHKAKETVRARAPKVLE